MRIVSRRFFVSQDRACAVIGAEFTVDISGVGIARQRATAHAWGQRSRASRLARHALSENSSSPFRTLSISARADTQRLIRGSSRLVSGLLKRGWLQVRGDRRLDLGELAALREP